MRRLTWFLVGLALLVGLAACGNDDKKDDPTPTPEAAAPVLNAGPDLAVGPDVAATETSDSVMGNMPGCSDLNSDECPTPLDMDLDGTATLDGVSISYPSRYFDATTGDTAITIAPSERNKFQETANFEISFADSIDAALAPLTDPITGEWSNDTLSGTIGVVKDDTQDPPVNTTIGAFSLAGDRTLVITLVTTGQYGWELYSRVYEGMLNSVSVTGS